MNTLEQSIDRLKDKIKMLEAGVADVGNHLAAAASETVDGLDARLKIVLAKCEARREEAGEAGHAMRRFLEEKKSELVAKYEDWKTDREIGRIERHADQKERQAANAIVFAALALLQAEAAIVEAVKARKMAVEVSG